MVCLRFTTGAKYNTEITNATLQSRHYEKCIKASLQSFSHHKTRKEAYSQDQALITPFFLLGHIFETTRPQNKDQLCQNSRAFKIFHSSSRENYTISWSLKIPSVLVVLWLWGKRVPFIFITWTSDNFKHFMTFYTV